jgi:hypothetical protein
LSANIFISFASQDRKVATTLCSALESRGFSCWISTRDIKPGDNFQIAIVRAIREAKMMLLVFTANSNASDEMSKELALASQQKLIVVPLRVEDVAPNEAFAYEFATRQWIDFFADWEAAINQLCVRLAQAMPQDLPPPPAPPALTPPPPAPTPPVAPPPAPTPVAEVRPTPQVKAAPVEPPKPIAPVAPVATPAAVVPPTVPTPPISPKAAEPKPPEPKTPDAKPQAASPAEAKRAPEAKPAPVVPPKPVEARTAADPAPETRKRPVGLFIGIGVAALLVVGAVIALPMVTAKKPAPLANGTPSITPLTTPSAESAAAPASVVAPSGPSVSSIPVVTQAESGASASSASAATAAPAPAAPKPRHKAHAATHTTIKADVPY